MSTPDSTASDRAVRAGWSHRVPSLLAWGISALGLALRVEHALTFDGVKRGSDYNVHIQGVRWMMEHWRPFDFAPELSSQVSYQPPLWHALGAVILLITGSERAIAGIAVTGWAARQAVLALIMREAAPNRPWSGLAALSIHAVLPLSVLTDGKLNPEGLTTTLFTISAYWLWRMERELVERQRIAPLTAIAFGVTAGLSLLTKATGIVLWFGLGIVLAWQAWRLRPRAGLRGLWRPLLSPVLIATMTFVLVVGWWCGPNLQKYGHPFPHAWRDMTAELPPLFYRRPLGWALPFEWKPYVRFPIIRTQEDPRPNFWAVVVTGTWSDWYNRGTCRVKGGGETDKVWGAHDPMWGGRFWNVSGRCIQLHRAVLLIGFFLTPAAVLAVFQTAIDHVRSRGVRGSLALPALSVLVVAFVMLFALVYPFDWGTVLNPRYVMSATTLISACLGIALAQVETTEKKRTGMHALVLLANAAVVALVVYQRFG